MHKITTVLFDFDGTVMDTREVVLRSWQHTFLTLEGKERDPEEIYRTFGEPLEYTISRLFPQMEVADALAIYRGYHKNNFGEMIRVFPGVRELLEEVKAAGFHTALVTSRTKATTMEGIVYYELDDYFDELVTCDDTEKHKPDPEPVLVALRKLGRTPEEAIMVGDTLFDIKCAKNAGTKSVLVDWSVAVPEAERQGENAPDFIIETPEELMKILYEEREKGEGRLLCGK